MWYCSGAKDPEEWKESASLFKLLGYFKLSSGLHPSTQITGKLIHE